MALDPAEYHALLRLLDSKRFDNPQVFDVIRDRVSSIREVAREIRTAVEEEKEFSDEVVERGRAIVADELQDQDNFGRFVNLPTSDPERSEQAQSVVNMLRQRHGLADYVVRKRRGPVGGLPQRKPQEIALETTGLQTLLSDIAESVVLDMVSSFEDQRYRNLTMWSLLLALCATPGALMEIVKGVSPVLVEQLGPHIAEVLGAPHDKDGLPTGDARLRWLVGIARKYSTEKLLIFVFIILPSLIIFTKFDKSSERGRFIPIPKSESTMILANDNCSYNCSSK